MSTFDSQSLPDAGTESVTVDLAAMDAERPSTVILETIMAMSSKDVTEVDPLTDSVDPDALDSLFDYQEAISSESSVEFVIDKFAVTVREDGLIRIDHHV